MTEGFLTPEELAIANGTAAAEILHTMLQTLRDRIAGHVFIAERSGDRCTVISGQGLLELADTLLTKATVYAGSAVQTEKEVRNVDSPAH